MAYAEIQTLKKSILNVNAARAFRYERSMGEQIADEALWMVSQIEKKAKEICNDFIASVAASVYKWQSASEKQAYCLARFADENSMFPKSGEEENI